MTQAILAQAIEAIRSGDKTTGQKLLAQVLRADPRSESAWLWMSQIVETDQQRLDCLRRIIAINPNNAAARKGIALLESRLGSPPAPAPPAAPAFVEPEPEPDPEPDLWTPVYEEPSEAEPEVERDALPNLPAWEAPQPIFDEPPPPPRSRLSEIQSAPVPDVISSLRGGAPAMPERVEEETAVDESEPAPVSRFAFAEAQVEPQRERRPFPISRRAIMRVGLLLVVVGVIIAAVVVVLPRLTAPQATPVAAPEVGQLAAVSGQGDESQLALLQSDGSGLAPITNQPGVKANPVWSPDGARIAFVSDGQIAIVNADGQGYAQLTGSPGQNVDPAWSPDGARIAFASDREGDFDIFVMDADGSSAFNLTRFKGDDRAPVWTTDGMEIIFQSDRNGHADIYRMRVDGSNVTALTREPGDEIDPALSFDGARIAYVSANDDGSRIVVMNLEDAASQTIVDDETQKRRPAWTANDQIMYTVVVDDGARLFVTDLDGSEVQPIASGVSEAQWQPSGTGAASIAVAPAPPEETQSAGPANPPGGKIYFVVDSDLYVMNPDGSGARVLAGTREHEAHPSVAFSNARIAYDASVSVTQQLFFANLDGSSPITLTDSSASVRRPIWSPDETRIVYEVEGDRGPDLAVLNVDGSGVAALTTRPGYDGCASWNADGARLAFTSDRDGGLDIYTMNANGADVQRLTRHRADDRCAAWSRDGSSIAFISDREGQGVYLMNPDGSNVRLLVAIRDATQPNWSLDGRFLIVASSQTGNSDIYLIALEEKAVWNLTNTSDVDEVDPTWGP
jgi:TolB protein